MSCDHKLANEWARYSGKNASYITNPFVIGCKTNLLQEKKINMLFAGLGSVRMVKNCDLGLEYAALGHSFSPCGPPSRQIRYIYFSRCVHQNLRIEYRCSHSKRKNYFYCWICLLMITLYHSWHRLDDSTLKIYLALGILPVASMLLYTEQW